MAMLERSLTKSDRARLTTKAIRSRYHRSSSINILTFITAFETRDAWSQTLLNSICTNINRVLHYVNNSG